MRKHKKNIQERISSFVVKKTKGVLVYAKKQFFKNYNQQKLILKRLAIKKQKQLKTIVNRTERKIKKQITKKQFFKTITKKRSSLLEKRIKKRRREVILPLYFDWQVKLILEKNTARFFRPFKKHWQEAVALLLLITIIGSSFLFQQTRPVLGATYTWVQTDWSIADTGNYPVHPGDQTNWVKYYAKDAALATTTGAIILSATADSRTQTTDDDFNSGTLNDVVASEGDLRLLPWYNSNWNYRKAINISNSASGTTDYSVEIELTPSNFDYSHASSTLADLRFTTSTAATTAIPYWLETVDTSATSTIWVKVPSLPANSTTTIYMYYGNSSAANESDIYNSFIFYDDFSRYSNTSDSLFLENWETLLNNNGDWSIDSGRLKIWAINSNGRRGVFINNTTYDTNITDMILEYDAQFIPGGSYWESGWNVRSDYSSSINGIRIRLYDSGNKDIVGSVDGCSGSLTYSTDNIHYKVITKGNTLFEEYEDGILKYSCNSITKVDGYPAWFIGSSSAQVTAWIDNVSIRKYLSTNPANTFGAEEIIMNNGSLISSSMDTGQTSDFSTLAWNASSIASTTVKFQIASSADNVTWSDFQGPDGATNTYYTTSGTNIYSEHNGNRYVKYKAFLETTSSDVTPELHDVTINYNYYPSSTTLTSSPYDSSSSANAPGSLAWSETLTTGTDVKFQIRTSPDNSTWTDFQGPDGATSTYFSAADGSDSIPSALSDGVDDRWVQYKVFLTSTGANAPTLSDVTFTYVVNASPEASITGSPSLSGSGTVIIDYDARDPDSNEGSNTPWFITPSFSYSLDNGANWTDATSTCFASGDWDNKAVSTSTWNSYQAVWNPKCEAGIGSSTYTTTAKVRVTVDDNEGGNNTAISTSSTFTLDTISPVAGAHPVLVDASASPTTLTVSVTDNSSMEMKIGLNSDLSDASWTSYDSTTTFNGVNDPDTIYVQFRDIYNNTTTISNVVTPMTPGNIYYQDISNPDTNEYREFVSWSVVDAPGPGFKQYNVHRSTGGAYSVVSTSTRLVNYIIDDGLSSSTEYYYKISTEDSDNNVSFFSPIVSDVPQGSGGTDLSSPSISSVATSSLGTNSITITWTTNELSDSTVGYSTTLGNFSTETGVASMVTSHSVTLTGLTPNNTYYFQVKSTDPSTNTGTDNNGGNGYSFATSEGPTISNVTIPEIDNNTAKISWLTNINADSYAVYSLNSDLSSSTETGSPALTTNHEVELSSLSGGNKYYFYVKSTDASSDETTDKNVVDGIIEYYDFITTQDTAAPTVSSISASPATSSAIIAWTTNELANSYLNYGTSAAYGSSATSSTLTINHIINLSSLTENTLYHYQVVSTDANSNTAASSDQTFTTNAEADSTAPTISSVTTGSTSLTSAIITWNTNENSNSLIDYGITDSLGSLAGQIDDSTTTHSVTLSDLSENTTYYYQVRSHDSDGNIGTDDNGGSFYSFTTTQDSTAPTITNATSSTVSDTSATITWTTNELSDSLVNYGTTNAYGSATAKDTTLTYQHSVKIESLTKQTTYHFQVVSADADDNSASSVDATFTTTDNPGIVETVTVNTGGVIFMESSSAASDTTAPTITNVQIIDVDYTSATITWSSNENSDTFVEYGTTAGYEQGYLGAYDSVTSHSLTLSSLIPNTNYLFRTLGKDDSGNLGYSPGQSFSTLALETEIAMAEVPEEEKELVEDILKTLETLSIPGLASVSDILEETAKRVVSPPLIAGDYPLVETGSDWATVTWVTDKPANSIVAYAEEGRYEEGKEEPYIIETGDFKEKTPTHIVELTNLKADTTYHYQARSKSPLGDWAKSTNKTFTTLSLLPQISKAKIVSVEETSAVLAWGTNLPTKTMVDIINTKTGEKTEIEDNSYLKEHQLIIEDLAVSTDYSLQIFSSDEQGNLSESEILSFATSLSLEPPIISQVRINAALIPGKIERIQAIITWKTNKPANGRVLYEEGATKSKELAYHTSIYPNLEMEHIIVTTAFKPGKVYRFRVESTDAFGNTSVSQDYTILTPKPKESVLDLMIKNFEDTFGFLKRLEF